jgi:hypothetical protein
MSHSVRSLLILGIALIPVAVTAQGAPTLEVGTLVKWTDNGRMHRGHVFDIDEAAGVLIVGGAAEDDMERVSLSALGLAMRTQRGRRWTGFGIGLGAGAVVGAALGFASGDDECGEGLFGCLFVMSAGEKAVLGGATLGLLGGLLGAVVAPGEKWTPLGASAAASGLSAVIEPNRLGLSLSF